jgi:inner membrane protein
MFIGHLPGGYLLTHALLRAVPRPLQATLGFARLMMTGLVASVAPDFDLLHFYLVDARQHLHHGYLNHIPLFWALAAAIALLLAAIFRHRQLAMLAVIVFCNVQLHLLLDTIAGKIRWLYPISPDDFVLAEVPAVHRWWVLNFLLHWTFLLEVLVVTGAALVLWKRRRAGYPA